MQTLAFLRDVTRRPLEMGAVLPSSRGLAARMIQQAEIATDDVVVELGAGTGAFTSEIVRHHPENPLVLLEPGPDLAADLRQRFPHARVTTMRAEELRERAAEVALTHIDRVVSGLPWALWSEPRQRDVLDALIPLLTPDARLVTFHYVHSRALGRVRTLRRLLTERFQSVTHTDAVWANVPPAYVHVASSPRPA